MPWAPPRRSPSPPWRSSAASPRIRGRRLQRLRRWLFEEAPLCVMCQTQGRVTVATIRDHIVPLAEGGSDSEDNVQPLCQGCSDIKTAREAKRGTARTRIDR